MTQNGQYHHRRLEEDVNSNMKRNPCPCKKHLKNKEAVVSIGRLSENDPKKISPGEKLKTQAMQGWGYFLQTPSPWYQFH